MFQQILAIIIIIFFLSRLFWKKEKQQISRNEFIFWLIFWILALISILLLKQLDKLAVQLGFSSSGIDILLYLGVIIMFYLIFRLRLKLEQIEKNITKIVREITINKKPIELKTKKYD